MAKRDMRLSNGLPVTVVGERHKDGVSIHSVIHDNRNIYELLDGSEVQWLEDELKGVVYA